MLSCSQIAWPLNAPAVTTHKSKQVKLKPNFSTVRYDEMLDIDGPVFDRILSNLNPDVAYLLFLTFHKLLAPNTGGPNQELLSWYTQIIDMTWIQF